MRHRVRRGALRVAGAIAVCTAAIACVCVFASPVAAQDAEVGASEGDAAQQLADRYAPIFMLKAQDEQCDTYGEPYAPMSVDALLGNQQVALRQVGNGDPTVMRGPTARDLYGLGGGFYLDFPGDSLQPGCLYERDFRRFTTKTTATVYAHIAHQADERDKLALQYWIYWYYNDWNNKHESDWEFIQLLFPVSTVEEALTVEPESVGYAQHEGGERAAWDAGKLEREGTHPFVYSSVGSHASYYGSALFLGRSGNEGFGCDNTDGPSRRVEPAVVLLPDVVPDGGGEFAWLGFEGRWGERHEGPFNGPDGPYRKPRWTKPVDWHDGLRPSSVVVPTGDAQAEQLVGAFCGVVEWGSVQVIKLQTSPTRLLITIGLVVGLGAWLIHRTSWERVEPLPIVARRRSGQILRASVLLYRRHAATFATLGVIYLPLAALAGLLVGLIHVLPFAGDLLSLFEEGGEATRLVLSLLVGGFAGLLAFVIVSAAVAAAVGEIARGERPSPVRALLRVRDRLRDLVVGVARAFVIVLLLDVTVVLLPFGVHRLVRYQLLAPVVMLEGHDGRAALARSSRLVKGRWWNTAIMVTAIHGALAVGGVAVGLVLLLVLTSLPLWLLSSLVTLVGALFMPLGAIALTLLYGDAVAQHAEREAVLGVQVDGVNTTGIDSGPEMKLDAR
jgi:hypothetical protein